MVLAYGEQAIAACSRAYARLGPDDLDRPTACTEFTVRQLVDHLQRSMVLLGGIAGAALTVDPAEPPGRSIEGLAGGAVAAWRRRGVDGEVAVGRTITPAALAAQIIVLELVVHAWDLTPVTGHEIDVSPELCEHLLGQAHQLITPDRRGRSFAAEVAVAPQAPALDRLIAFTGRTP